MNQLTPCYGCGEQIHITAKSCPKCGAVSNNIEEVSPTNAWLLLIVCFFGGVLGIHHFMAGRIGWGIIYLFTLGFFFIGAFLDFFMILFGGFTDSKGRRVRF